MLDLILKTARDILWLSKVAVLRLRASFRRNSGLALLSLAMAASLWVFITNEQNPPRTDIFPQDIPVRPINLPQGLDLLGEVRPVRIRVVAPLDFWERLSANNFKAVVDLSSARAGFQDVDVKAESLDPRFKVLDVIPSMVTVRLETLRRESVPLKVNLQGNPAFGYTYDPPKVTLEKVTVLGPDPLVTQVESAQVDVNLNDTKSTISRSFKLVARGVRGYEIEGVTLDPPSVDVEVPIKQQVQYQSVTIIPELKGNPAPGYWVSGASVQPAMVTVFGAKESLVDVNFLRTRPIEINDAIADFTRTVVLDLPQGINIVGNNSVTVKVSVAPAQGSATFLIAPQLEGLAAGRQVGAVSPESVEVTVIGDVPTLKSLQPSDISLSVDLNGKGQGFFLLDIKSKVSKNIKVARIEPAKLGVTIK